MTLLTTKEIQALVNVDKSTIYRMAEDGRIPAIKVGRQWRFPQDEIDRWLTRTGAEADDLPSPLERVMLPPAIQGFADLLAELFGVMAVVTDMRGTPLTEVANPCGFFDAIQDHPGVVEKCIDGWRRLGDDTGLEARFVPSHLGFLCARTFIRVGSELVGMVIVGGVAPREWPPTADRLEAIGAALGMETDALEARIHEVYHLDDGAQRRILDTLPRIADLISELAAARSQLVAKLDQIAALAGVADQRSNP